MYRTAVLIISNTISILPLGIHMRSGYHLWKINQGRVAPLVNEDIKLVVVAVYEPMGGEADN